MKFIFFIFIVFSGFAYSASFDCAKARTQMEISICSNSELGKLDEQLASTYNDLKVLYSDTFFKSVIRKDQLNWLKMTSKNFESEKNIQKLIKNYGTRITVLLNGKVTYFGYKLFNGQIDTFDKNINEIQKDGYVTIHSKDLIFIESEYGNPSTDSSPTPKCYQNNKFYSISKKTELTSNDLFNMNSLNQIAIELYKDAKVTNQNLDMKEFLGRAIENLENRLEEVSIIKGILTVNHLDGYYSSCAHSSASVNVNQVKKYLSMYLQNQLGF
jgi:uncharacterized protein